MTDADPTEPVMPEPAPAPPAGPASAAGPRRRPAPVVRWIRGLSQAAYAGLLVLVIVLLLLVAVLSNPGEEVGPVKPADPPVGGPGLPATRL